MPMITIKFDDQRVENADILVLSETIQKIVSEATGIKDVFVYADSPKIKLKIAPIEVFIEMSASKIGNRDELFSTIKSKLSKWKKDNNFSQPINLTLIPMNWKFEVNI